MKKKKNKLNAPIGMYGGGTLDEKYAKRVGLKTLKTKEQRASKTIGKTSGYN